MTETLYYIVNLAIVVLHPSLLLCIVFTTHVHCNGWHTCGSDRPRQHSVCLIGEKRLLLIKKVVDLWYHIIVLCNAQHVA